MQNQIDIITSDDNDEIDGFWYSDDDAIAGEPQFVTDVDEQYSEYLVSFGPEATDTPEEFAGRWQYITADDIEDDEQLRDNLRIEQKFIYFDNIRRFVETELAKYDD
jgi:hypothetical protein